MKPRTMFWGIIAHGIVATLGLAAGAAWARPNGLPRCLKELNICTAELDTCNTDLAACLAEPHAVFPGDGVVGPALSYTDNGDGTATDNNTGLMWELKDNKGGIHDVGNLYTWSSSGTAPDGTLFTVFLATLNNTCDGDETTACTSNAGCAGIGNGLCGHAGHRDWRIPNIKELQSIVDYGQFNPAIDPTFPGLTVGSVYWSSTSVASDPSGAWAVAGDWGFVLFANKVNVFNGHVRAVRGGS